MKTLALVIASIFILGGIALMALPLIMWNALQIQAGLGNSAPMMAGLLKIVGGLVCIGIGWVALQKS